MGSSSSPPPEGVGLSDPRQSAHRRKILGVIDSMRATGVGEDVDLPMIAVIGIQSAGKSSLIESISGITLPRASGTCTRCPTECRLSYSDKPWSCKVILRRTVDSQGQPLGVADNILFGPTITDKREVEERIYRAQRAILNPSTSHKTFLTGADWDPERKSELSFSKNCVCLELSGPDLTDLSFCDLPGLIASAGRDGKDSDIGLVKDLVATYISRPSCLILLTVTCQTDFENQGAHHMAKQYDPDGQRTIGVLTKPDLIPPGEEDHWLRFIRDEAKNFANGWFAVKQPAKADLDQGTTWKESRKQEELFFSTKTPWSTERNYRHRFGTRNLTESLSNILSDLIKRRLPELGVELHKLLKETESQLGKLSPAPSEDAQGEIISLVNGLARELAAYVEGTPDENGIHQKIRPLNRAFVTAIGGTAQRFCPFEKGSGRSFTHPSFLSLDDEPPTHSDDENVICVEEVKMLADTSTSREILDHSLFIVTKKLIRLSTEQWELPSFDLLEKVFTILAKEVNRAVDEHFERFQHGMLHHDVKTLVNEVLEERQASASEMIRLLLTMENKAPSTVYDPYLVDCRNKLLQAYREARRTPKEEPFYDATPDTNETGQDSQTLFVPGYSAEPKEELPSGATPYIYEADPYDHTLLYMANARAYFHVTLRRFVHMVPMVIDQELLRGFDLDRGLDSTLRKGLGIIGRGCLEKAMKYLPEPPDVKSRRESLREKRERLLSAKREFRSI